MRYLALFGILVLLRVLRTVAAIVVCGLFGGAYRVPLWAGFVINALYWGLSILACVLMFS